MSAIRKAILKTENVKGGVLITFQHCKGGALVTEVVHVGLADFKHFFE